MTTCVYDRRVKRAVGDTQNTDNGGAIYRTDKLEWLKDGRLFMGAGNCYLIGATKRWAEAKFLEAKRPTEYACLFEHGEDYDFTCLVISKDGESVWLVDVEMEPLLVTDDFIGIGSGAAYAIGAMMAGADAEKAVRLACERDGNSSLPLTVVNL